MAGLKGLRLNAHDGVPRAGRGKVVKELHQRQRVAAFRAWVGWCEGTKGRASRNVDTGEVAGKGSVGLEVGRDKMAGAGKWGKLAGGMGWGLGGTKGREGGEGNGDRRS